MPQNDICELCKRGRLIGRTEEITFHQWTDKGYVRCRCTIPMQICDTCGSKTWDEAAEAILEQAVKAEYDKLPNPPGRP